ncbi:MAG: hypothetical protein P4M05_12615 [Bradyrhizobium sp.]|nr:hypothetical protein [Bradyrhizobium sp.]
MKIFRIAAAIALLTGPAYAQSPALNLIQDGPSTSPAQKAADEARDKAYKESLRKIPDAKAPADPWGNVRSGDAAKASVPKTSAPKASAAKVSVSNSKTAATVKPRTKTGTDAN